MGHQKQDDAAGLFNGQYRDSDSRTSIVSSEKETSSSTDGAEAMLDTREIGYGNEEGCDPLDLLPEEIWDVIFEIIKTSPKDLIACCAASGTWDNLLSQRKSTWLFEEIFPLLFKYLKNEDILKCRQVCKSWRNSVDKHIEDHPCHHPSEPEGFDDGDTRRESVYYPLIKKKLHQIRFYTADQLTRFRLEMEHSAKNPIIGRSVSFYARPQDEWMLTALHFLSEFGRHIWYFSFETFHLPVTMLKWLRQCLALLPNLKKLKVYTTINHHTFEADVTNPEVVNELMQEISTNPLPPLPALETLEISAKGLPRIIQDTIISTYADKVQRLEVDEWSEIYVNEENYPLADLKELIVTVESNDVLDILTNLNCPILRKLTMFFRYRDIDLARLSNVLRHFRENLRVLKITLSAISDFSMNSFLTPFSNLVLPKLKVLILINAEDLPHNFLRGMKSVEYFHFEKWNRCEASTTGNHLSFVQMRGFIPHSSTRHGEFWVWDMLPLLKRLTFHDLGKEKQVTTRSMYEYDFKRNRTPVL